MRIKIWKEWYDIILRISLTKRKSVEEIVKEIITSNECLNLPRVPTSKLKEINVNIDKELISPKEVENKIEKYIFCE